MKVSPRFLWASWEAGCDGPCSLTMVLVSNTALVLDLCLEDTCKQLFLFFFLTEYSKFKKTDVNLMLGKIGNGKVTVPEAVFFWPCCALKAYPSPISLVHCVCLFFQECHKKGRIQCDALKTPGFKLPLFRIYNVPPLSSRISYYRLSAEDLCQFSAHEFVCQPIKRTSLTQGCTPSNWSHALFCSSLWQPSSKRVNRT